MKRYKLIPYITIINDNTQDYLLPSKNGDLVLFQDLGEFMDAVADLIATKKLPESKLEPIRQAFNNLYSDEV